jgi:protein SCO1/2
MILAVTAAWWMLALWPAGAIEPAWLVRTRAACFGSGPDGLPDAGGWILLIGEPLGMLVMLGALWGRSLRRDLRWIRDRRPAAIGAMLLAAAAFTGFATLAVRLTQAVVARRGTAIEVAGTALRVDRPPPSMKLIDQYGRQTSLTDFRGRVVLLTFAYGHCATVCPSLVSNLQAARRMTKWSDVALVVVTLDPWRDTPDRLPALAEHWGLAPGDRVLSGSVSEVEAALNELGIGWRRNDTNGDVDHGTAVMILDAHGRIAWRLDGGQSAVVDMLRTLRATAGT